MIASDTSGMDATRLQLLEPTIRADIAAGLYHGAVIQVARGGQVRSRRPSGRLTPRRPVR